MDVSLCTPEDVAYVKIYSVRSVKTQSSCFFCLSVSTERNDRQSLFSQSFNVCMGKVWSSVGFTDNFNAPDDEGPSVR